MRAAMPLDAHTGDDGKLYRRSRELLLTHEDPGRLLTHEGLGSLLIHVCGVWTR